MSNEKLVEALRSLRLKFTSGNDVPVPEARITRAEWEAIAHTAEAAQAHDLVKTGDADAHPAICDANGEVVLAYCRRCHQGEGDLEPTCRGEHAQAAEPVAWLEVPQGDQADTCYPGYRFHGRQQLSAGIYDLFTRPQPAQDAKVMFAPPQTEEDVMAYLQIARLHVKRFREILQDAIAKESGR